MTLQTTSVDVVSALIAIQKREGMTDYQFAETLGYKNRISWHRIKHRRTPINDKLLYRAINRWPELENILSGNATSDRPIVTGDSTTDAPQKPCSRILRGLWCKVRDWFKGRFLRVKKGS